MLPRSLAWLLVLGCLLTLPMAAVAQDYQDLNRTGTGLGSGTGNGYAYPGTGTGTGNGSGY
jgi:hypothetical protein